MLATFHDELRIIDIVNKEIEAGKLQVPFLYLNYISHCRFVFSFIYIQSWTESSTDLKARKQRQRKGKKEEKLAQQETEGENTGLRALQNSKASFNDMVKKLEKEATNSAKNKGKKRKAAADPPTEEEFAALQEKMFAKK